MIVSEVKKLTCMSLGTKPASTAALDAPTEVHHPTPYRTLNITFQQSALQCCFIELRRFYGISSLHPPLCIPCHQCKVYCHKIIQDTDTWLLQNHMLLSKMETWGNMEYFFDNQKRERNGKGHASSTKLVSKFFKHYKIIFAFKTPAP